MNFRFIFPPPPQVVSCLVLLSYFSLPSLVLGAIDGLQIMQQVYDKKQPETIETTVDMTLVDKSGTKRTRKIKSYTQHTDNRTNRILFFLEPPDIAGTGLLIHDYNEDRQPDDQWVYLPSLYKAKRIASSKRSGSFMGSDFSYGDLTRKDFNDYTYSLLKELDTESGTVWVIESIPLSQAVIERDGYSKSLYLVRQKDFEIVKMVHWLAESNSLKYYQVEQFKTFQGFTIPVIVNAKTVNNKDVIHQTRLISTEIKINQYIAPSTFTLRRLETGR